MGTAQDAFNAMMSEIVVPRLKALGFKGSGGKFTWPHESHWMQVGFQKSASNASDRVKFTLNASVVSKAAWEELRRERPHFPEKPAPNVVYTTRVWFHRIGLLLGQEDRWWVITGDGETAAIALEVVDAVERVALPAMIAAVATH